ncbi:MAG: FHA domain-containing protein [Acidimicrobiia bacterium]
MQCPNCDTVIPEGSHECPTCGWVVESDPTVAYVPIQANHPALTKDEASAVEGIRGWALVVEKGPQAGMTFLLQDGTTTVGRHPESDIFLDDITVSRHHCRFVCEDASIVIEDSGSTNGTYVNGARVDKGRLEAGDEVLIGRFHLIVAHGDV